MLIVIPAEPMVNESQQSKVQPTARARPKYSGFELKRDLQQSLQFWAHELGPIINAKWLAQIPTYGTRT